MSALTALFGVPVFLLLTQRPPYPPLRDLEGPLRLNLTEEDKAALEAFLNALTDSAFLADPKFSDPFR